MQTFKGLITLCQIRISITRKANSIKCKVIMINYTIMFKMNQFLLPSKAVLHWQARLLQFNTIKKWAQWSRIR